MSTQRFGGGGLSWCLLFSLVFFLFFFFSPPVLNQFVLSAAHLVLTEVFYENTQCFITFCIIM